MEDLLAAAGLAALLLAFPLYIAVDDWRRHRRSRQRARAAGWRYQRRRPRLSGRQPRLSGGYVLTGRTAGGASWELQQDGYQRLFLFTISELHAPYGTMLIVPRMSSSEARRLLSEAGLRTVQIEEGGWQARYRALATHDHLVRRTMTPRLVRQLLAWPPRERPGALHYIAWRDDGLEIRGRLTGEWTQVERIVALGEGIAAQIAATDLRHVRPGGPSEG